MSESALIVDTPDKCRNCDLWLGIRKFVFEKHFLSNHFGEESYDRDKYEDIDFVQICYPFRKFLEQDNVDNKIPDWCPLIKIHHIN